MKIFVGSIREHITEDTLRNAFSPYGDIECIMHKGSYAFVFMPNNEEATQACQALHRTELQGCVMNVEESKPSAVGNKPVYNSSAAASAHASAGGGILAQRPPQEGQPNRPKKKLFHHVPGRIKLIAGGIGNITQEQLEAHFAQHGTVFETFILADRGVGFVHVDELKAEYIILATNESELAGNIIRVNYSSSKELKKKPGPDTQYVKLYLPGLSDDADENLLRCRFEMFGDVRECTIIKRSKCAFIHIDSAVAEFAMDCLKLIPFFGVPLRPQLAKGEQLPQQLNQLPYNQNYVQNVPIPPIGVVPNNYQQVPLINQHRLIYPQDHYLASLELGPGFGPSAGSLKMASLPPAPQSQTELREFIERRCKLEMVHPFEKHLIETFDGNAKNVPQRPPPPEFLRLVRDRAILKVRLLRAQERGFDVYGTAAQMYTSQSTQDPYGFGSVGKTSAPLAKVPKLDNQVNGHSSGHSSMQSSNDLNTSNPSVLTTPPAPLQNIWMGPSDSYNTAYGNSQAGGPISLKKEYVPRRTPY